MRFVRCVSQGNGRFICPGVGALLASSDALFIAHHCSLVAPGVANQIHLISVHLDPIQRQIAGIAVRIYVSPRKA
jgi:hypothetical protein